MLKPFNIWKNVYAVGGAELSHPSDCFVYLIGGEEMVLIDSGAGESFERIVDNIRKLGLQPERLRAVIATHAHIDHIGSLYRFREEFGVQVIAHKLETEAIETGIGTGAEFYRLNYKPCKVDIPLNGSEEVLRYGGYELKVIHIPGHTPGVLRYTWMQVRGFSWDCEKYQASGQGPDSHRVGVRGFSLVKMFTVPTFSRGRI